MKLRTLFLSATVLTAASATALAATDVIVKVDEAKMLAVTVEPSTVVVGNPNIADITVQTSRIFIHGRNFGSTNIIVLDADGNELAALDVTSSSTATIMSTCSGPAPNSHMHAAMSANPPCRSATTRITSTRSRTRARRRASWRRAPASKPELGISRKGADSAGTAPFHVLATARRARAPMQIRMCFQLTECF